MLYLIESIKLSRTLVKSKELYKSIYNSTTLRGNHHYHSLTSANLSHISEISSTSAPVLVVLKSASRWHCHSLTRTSSTTWQHRPFHTSLSMMQQRQQQQQSSHQFNIRSSMYYMAAVGVIVFGLSYAAVPLYRIFCQAYSLGGALQQEEDAEKVAALVPVRDRKIKINFNADTAAAMTWNFRPQQRKIELTPGETALAFYTAKNPTDRDVIGVSTYNVVPFDAGQYFNKIQCFCFEEQMLGPHEEVHMPVFFYIDPEFADDPAMDGVEDITLSYTFFEALPGTEIPLPGFMKRKQAQ